MKRGLRVHGALDLTFAALYAYLGFAVGQARSTSFNLALGAVVLLLAAAGVALLVGWRGARVIALVASFALLAFAATVITLLVAGAAYLRGIYGPLGQGMAWVSLIIAALVIELCVLLPVAQIRFLRRDDVRAGFHR
jgi:hypothetical protein